MLHVRVARALPLHGERAARLEDAVLDFVDAFEALAPADAMELGDGDQFPGQFLLLDLSVADERRVAALQDLVEAAVPEEIADDDVVREEQREGADETAGHAVVVPDDRVLHRVGEREQHDEIERIELGQLALAEDPQEQDQEDVDEDRADDLLGEGNGEREHVLQEMVHEAPFKAGRQKGWKAERRAATASGELLSAFQPSSLSAFSYGLTVSK